MIRIIVISLLVIVSTSLFAQKEDHLWLFGKEGWFDPMDTTWGATNIDYDFDPPKIYYVPERPWHFGGTNASICDKNGNLLLYTNGQVVYAGDHSIIEDTINYNDQWDNWNYTYWVTGELINDGLPTMQGALILPLPDREGEYYIFNLLYDLDAFEVLDMQYSKVEFDENGQGQVTERDVIVLSDSLASGSMNAVRHANGRDWWVLFPGERNDVLFKYLFTPEGIHQHSIDTIGTPSIGGLGQMFFSPQGDKMAFSSWFSFSAPLGLKVAIMDFDRCTGDISNYSEQFLKGPTFSHGVSWSPNGRFVYATDSDVLYQYDTRAEDVIASRLEVEEYDGFRYSIIQDTTPGGGNRTRFGWMGLAPDGKIYLSSTSGGSRVMHKINNPNYLGEECDMDQHSVYLPTVYDRTMPNFPNFRLGPLDGSGCDTLDLDNNPIAKYRYVQDSLDYRQLTFFDLSYFDPVDYEWTFGDGDSSTEQEPVHVYSQDGVYEVCLTVSNEYNTDQTCRTIMVGTTATEDGLLLPDITLFPNPTADYLTVSLHDYVGGGVQLVLYSVAGAEVYSESLSGRSHVVDLSSLPVGAYFYTLRDRDLVLKTGNLVRI